MRGLVRPIAAELLGTFGFVFVGVSAVVIDRALNGGLGLLGIAFAHGLALSVLVSITLPISGGHINPAVSFGLFVAGKINARTLVLYALAQLAGAVLAVFCVKWLMPPVPAETAGFGVPRLAPTVTFGDAVALEGLLTFLLVSAVFGTAVSPEAPRIGGFGIGLAVTFDILVGGPLTGAAMNPARALGPALVAEAWGAHAVYWIGPLLGGAVAGVLWRFVLLPRDGAG